MLELMYELEPTVRTVLDELPPEDRANGVAVLALAAAAVFGLAWLAKELGPPLARLAAQMPPAGAALDKAAGTALVVALAMASVPEEDR